MAKRCARGRAGRRVSREEFAVLEAMLAAYWPSHPIPDAAAGAWFEILAPLDAELALESVKALYAEGRPFPPTAGEILRFAVDHIAAPQPWDAVVAEIREKLRQLHREHRFDSSPRFSMHEPQPCEFSSDAVSDLVRRSGGVNVWREELGSWLPGGRDCTTFLAQQRKIFEASSARAGEAIRNQLLGNRRLAALAEGTPQRPEELAAPAGRQLGSGGDSA